MRWVLFQSSQCHRSVIVFLLLLLNSLVTLFLVDLLLGFRTAVKLVQMSASLVWSLVLWRSVWSFISASRLDDWAIDWYVFRSTGCFQLLRGKARLLHRQSWRLALKFGCLLTCLSANCYVFQIALFLERWSLHYIIIHLFNQLLTQAWIAISHGKGLKVWLRGDLFFDSRLL